MRRYANLSGTSGVAFFEVLDGGIRIQFKDGDTYLYTTASAGSGAISRMIALAESGRELATFINMNKPRHAQKSR